MKKIKIDNAEIEVEDHLTIMQACEEAGKEVPRFCYHDKLSVAGNCRMCLVEVKGAPKPVASCAMPINEGMSIRTNTEKVKKAREGVMEFLLINHPLDCPVCDQAGECDLQDQTVAYGAGHSRFDENKRSVQEKHMGPLIKTYMTRCIHCTRCIRFADEVAGVNQIGALNRGENMEISTYLEKTIDSELSANVIDLCPVGALTSKPYQFEARPWELKKTETIDVMDAVGSNIRVDTYGWKVKRVLPRLNEDINEEWISDKTRYACDGLLTQRLDEPYIRKDNKLSVVEWSEALAKVTGYLNEYKVDEIAFLSGDLCDLETLYLYKKLSDALSIKNVECRQEGCNIPFTHPSQYSFNTKIADIEKSDCILIVGSNVRQEAPIINARIRKHKLATIVPIAVIGANLDLTFEYEHLGEDLNLLSDLISNKNNFSKIIEAAANPMIIIGNSILNRKDSISIFSVIEELIHKYKFLQDDWNGFNVLQIAAARTGALNLGLYKQGSSLEKIYCAAEDDKIKLIISLGADEINFDRLKGAKVIYIGTHGDKGANKADIILPSAAYTEKDGIYINTEGRLQYAFKASFPPGNAKEDWKIINELSNLLDLNWDIIDLANVRSMLQSDFSHLFNFDSSAYPKYERLLANKAPVTNLCNSNVDYVIKDFYLTNAITRNSKTMAECSQARNELLEQ